MGRRWTGWMVAALAALATFAAATVSLAAPAPTRVMAERNELLGVAIVVDGRGRALYRFTSERRGTIKCAGACTKLWPPLIVPKGATALAGRGVVAKRLGLVKRPDGRLQVTYGGFALYRYKGDAPSAVRGQGLGKKWYVINPAGRLVKKAPASGDSDGGGSSDQDSSGGGTPDTPPGYGY